LVNATKVSIGKIHKIIGHVWAVISPISHLNFFYKMKYCIVAFLIGLLGVDEGDQVVAED
jgi:hypothetical protein